MGDWDLSQNVWFAVLNELKECPLFYGIYDAKNGNDSFMHGVAVVMEAIASRAGDKVYEKFCDEFYTNIIASVKKCEGGDNSK